MQIGLDLCLIGGPPKDTVSLLEVIWCLEKVGSRLFVARFSAESEYIVMITLLVS